MSEVLVLLVVGWLIFSVGFVLGTAYVAIVRTPPVIHPARCNHQRERDA